MVEKNNNQIEESEYDSRGAELNILARLLEDKTQAYRDSLRGQTGAIEDYIINLQALYRHVKYFDENEGEHIQKVENSLESARRALKNRDLDKSQERKVVLRKAEKVDDNINEFRKDANLAMPTKNQVAPEEAALEGL